MAVQPVSTIEIFYCYADADKGMRDRLAEHLSPLQRVSQITGWFDGNIQAGIDREQEVETHFDSASIILLLISASFFASDYCYTVEMPRALEKRKAGTAHVIPIILRPVLWKDTPIGKLRALPTGEKAVTQWANPDEAWEDVARGIREVVRGLLPREILSQQETSILYPVSIDRVAYPWLRVGFLRKIFQAQFGQAKSSTLSQEYATIDRKAQHQVMLPPQTRSHPLPSTPSSSTPQLNQQVQYPKEEGGHNMAKPRSPLQVQPFPPTPSPHPTIPPLRRALKAAAAISLQLLLTLRQPKRQRSRAILILLTLLIILAGGSVGIYDLVTGNVPWNPGRIWHTQNPGTSQDLDGVAWSGSQFVAVGPGGTILTSP